MTRLQTAVQKRNKGFEDSHQEIIETAVRLISEKGVDSLSISAVARSMGINRTTVYYHFESREDLIKAVKLWSSERLAAAFMSSSPVPERIDYITRFVLENPELIKLWIDDFLSPGDIRERYPNWDALVAGMRETLAASPEGQGIDAEVFCVDLLASAFIGPRVFKNSVCPGADIRTIVERFRGETLRRLRAVALPPP
jgi:AcrR family transcriptional regulator